MPRILFLILICSLFSTNTLRADPLKIDPNGEIVDFVSAKGWAGQSFTVDAALIEKVREGNSSTDERAVFRLIEALKTTYFGAEVGSYSKSDAAFNITYLKHKDEYILVRFFLSTVSVSGESQETFFNLLENVMGEPISGSGDQIVRQIWDSYIDETKRQYDHGWINLSETENRAMAWGVPPDFIEVVITTRTDCTFLAVKGWFARQICR